MGRDEFFRCLKSKMCVRLGAFFGGPLVTMLVDNAEFFSRQRYYPGDFATAVELLGDLLRGQKGQPFSDEDDGDGRKRRLRPRLGGYGKRCQKKK